GTLRAESARRDLSPALDAALNRRGGQHPLIRRGRSSAAVGLRVLLAVVIGCSGGCSTVVSDRKIVSKSSTVVSDEDEDHYRLAASNASQSLIDEPPIITAPPLDMAPRTIRERGNDEPWNIALIEAVHIAIRNNPIIRQNAQFLSTTNTLLDNPEPNPSVFDVALQQTGVLFGARGEEAALSDFMPQISGNLQRGRDMDVQNNFFLGGGLRPGSTLVTDNGQFDARVDQQLITGGTFSIIHNWDYEQSNQPGLLFPSTYTGALGAEFRQPLLAGKGAEFTEIAGPIGLRNNIQSGVAQGIRIAQINEKIACVDFELAIKTLALEVGETYWQLFQAFREYDAFIAVRDSAYDVWQQVQANEDALGGAVVAQAEQTYLESRSRAEGTLGTIYETETRLRRMMGLPVADGRLLRPNAIPHTTDITPQWESILADAFSYRTELQRQKLSIQSFDWQLTAARSLLQPRLDFVGGYQLNGFGDHLIAGSNDDDITQRGYNSAYGALFRGSQQAWNMGLSFSMPIGFRAEQAQVRNLELKVAKARAALVAQEGEVRYELSNALQNIARWYTLMQTNESRVQVVQRQVDALQAEYQAGRGDRSTIDLLLRARSALASAQSEYFRSLTSYNTALWDLDYRRGTILLNNAVQFESVLAQR
ncbi:MAG TPA: TolC family protein, partial [Planctomycetaceae bacterium]|nr:TolC family protein [Planctomycetaceae bacterium]